MKTSFLKCSIVIFLLLVSISDVFAKEKIKLLPSDLLEIARNYQCDQIDDFYERPGMINPPYVYGYLEGQVDDSVIFWCEKKENNKRIYFLIIHSTSENKGLQKCQSKITWRNYPGGLSIYQDKNMTLDDFIYLKDTQKKAPKKIKMKHNSIRSYYDGLEELFYCHDGEWLVRQRD